MVHSRDHIDRENINGWIAEYTFQIISGTFYLFISVVFASFYISVCLQHCAFSDQIEALIKQIRHEIKRPVNDYDNQRIKTSYQRETEIMLQLCELVQLHSSTKE